MLPAHGEPFADHRSRIDSIVQHHRQRKDSLVALAAEGPQTGWELAGRLFKGVMERNVFQQRLALQETLAHCQSLAQEGRLGKQVREGLVRWGAA